MNSFKLSNSSNEDILVAFEPVGNTFSLPSNSTLQIVPFDKGSGLGTDALNIEMKMENGRPGLVIWAETHKFRVLYNGEQVNAM